MGKYKKDKQDDCEKVLSMESSAHLAIGSFSIIY